MPMLILLSLAGGAIGATLLLVTEDRTFNKIVPWLLLLATLLFFPRGLFGRDAERVQRLVGFQRVALAPGESRELPAYMVLSDPQSDFFRGDR